MAAAMFRKTSLDAGFIRLAILGTITGMCLIMIVFLLTDVRQKLSELASSPTDNIQWTLSQLEVEYLELQRAVAIAQFDIHNADHQGPHPREANLSAVRDRYDILYSRFATLTGSHVYRETLQDPALEGQFTQLRTKIYDLAQIIDAPDALFAAQLDQLSGLLNDQRPTLRRILSGANLLFVSQSDAARVGVAEVLKGLAFASAVLLAALSAMVVLFRSLARVSQRRLAQKLATSARLETIFTTSRDAIMVFDDRGRLSDANLAAREMFQFTEADQDGLPAGDLLRRDGRHGTVAVSGTELFAACRNGPKSAYRLSGRASGGGTFPVELSMASSNTEGRSVLVCVIRDISHQVESEVELKESRDQARAGERAKARFLGVISHEMRTPLNGILGTIDLMEENPDPAEHEAYLNVVRNSAQTLLDLVNDVLDITQIEGSDVVIHPAPFDLDNMIADIISSETPRARNQNNAIFRVEQAKIGWVVGDATRLRQVLLNLVSNAVKFTQDGQVTVAVERRDNSVDFTVSDTGIGMNEEDRLRIFEDFVRLDGAIAQQIQGTGLGLGIALRLTHAMQGNLNVQSVLGEGTQFRLSLPLPVSAPAPRAIQSEPELGAIPSRRILLVEDNPTNRFVARRMLERDGHSVTEAENGLQGVEKSAAEPFDVILMDVSMPVMDGVEATAAIRSGAGPCSQARIIALTAHVGEDVTERLKAAGLDDVIAKPIRARVLRRLLLEACEGGPGGARGTGRF